MFVGCQFSLYPMTDNFVEVILDAIDGLQDRQDLRVESDDLSTLVIGASDPLFEVLEKCFLKAAANAGHVVLTATFSRGCPGEPDDPLCQPAKPTETHLDPMGAQTEKLSGVNVAAQFSLYPLGNPGYMDIIYREIDATKKAGVFSRAKHFCTRLEGDAYQIFTALRTAFDRAANEVGHVVITATISKGSPPQV